MRSVIAVVVSVGLLAGGISAPLTHAHPDEHATDHHDGNAVHAHWAGHEHERPSSAPGGPALDAEDHDRAVYLPASVAVGAASFPVAALEQPVFVAPVSIERPAYRRLHVTRSHDPPSLESASPRPPPACLS